MLQIFILSSNNISEIFPEVQRKVNFGQLETKFVTHFSKLILNLLTIILIEHAFIS